MKLGWHRHAPLGGSLVGLGVIEAATKPPTDRWELAAHVIAFLVVLGGNLLKLAMDQDRHSDGTREELAKMRAEIAELKGKGDKP